MIKVPVLSLTAALLLLVVGGAAIAEAPHQAAGGSAYGTSVSIEPSGGSAFLLKARVTDLASGEVVAGPAVKLATGKEGQAESQNAERDEVVTLSATVDSATRTATYTLVIKRNQKVVAEHTSKVAL